jgi:hypothetical protein
MTQKPALEVFCTRCQIHTIKDAALWAHRHLERYNHPVHYMRTDTLQYARDAGVPVDKLLRIPA